MLNTLQTEAVCHKEGPCLTLAGPGSGKTTVLTERICHLIMEEGVSPERILVITFTKAAAMEMKERFDSRMGSDAPVLFGTFHSVFYHILRQAPQFAAYRLLDGREKLQIIKETAYHCKIFLEDDEALESLEREISFVKNSMMTPEEYAAQSLFQDNFVTLYEQFEARKEAYRLLDFDDMLSKTYRLLTQQPNVLATWQKRFSYLLIDEFQDINLLQFHMIRLLALPENNLFVVGDDDQCIYGFRGANPSIMLHFEKHYPRCRRILLDKNYRCATAIVDASLSLISHNRLRFEKKLESGQANHGALCVWRFADEMAEAQAICKEIQKERESGIPYHEMAVLFRNRSQGQVLAEEMRREGIPCYRKERMPNIYRNPILLDLIAYLRLSSKQLWRRDLFRIMNRPNRYLARASVTREWTTFEAWKQYYEEQPWLYDRIEQLERDVSFIKNLSPVGAITYIRKKIGYDMYLKESARNQAELERFYDVIDVLLALARDAKSIDALLEKWQEAGDFVDKMNAETQGNRKEGVGVYTLHGSKGLEFSEVFIIDCNEGVIPSPKAESAEQLEEERRLFYVGITRAKNKLYLSGTQTFSGKPSQPSRFLTEIGMETAPDIAK